MATTKKKNINGNKSACCGGGKCSTRPRQRRGGLIAPVPNVPPTNTGFWQKILAFFRLD